MYELQAAKNIWTIDRNYIILWHYTCSCWSCLIWPCVKNTFKTVYQIFVLTSENEKVIPYLGYFWCCVICMQIISVQHVIRHIYLLCWTNLSLKSVLICMYVYKNKIILYNFQVNKIVCSLSCIEFCICTLIYFLSYLCWTTDTFLLKSDKYYCDINMLSTSANTSQWLV